MSKTDDLYENKPSYGRKKGLKIAIIIADFYPHITKMLLDGVKQGFQTGRIMGLVDVPLNYEIIRVPGALEIPGVVSSLLYKRNPDNSPYFMGFVALGCVIRGETYHFEIVSSESARALMELSCDHVVAMGNGILTVENEAQAIERADPSKGNKGLHALTACLTQLSIQMAYKVTPQAIEDMQMNHDLLQRLVDEIDEGEDFMDEPPPKKNRPN